MRIDNAKMNLCLTFSFFFKQKIKEEMQK